MLGVGLVDLARSRLDDAPRNTPMPRMLARLWYTELELALGVPLAIDVALRRLAARETPPPPAPPPQVA